MKYARTFFALPTTNYAPDGLIKLGQLVVNPRLPFRALAEPVQPIPKIHLSELSGWHAEQKKGNDNGVGLFARIFDLITADFDGKSSDKDELTWQADQLVTKIIEPDQTYVDEAIKAAQVQKWLKDNSTFGTTIYMVTGIKIANGPQNFSSNYDDETSVKGELGGDPGTGGMLKLGLRGNHGNLSKIHQKGKPVTSFVYAYKLRKIHVSWRTKRISLGEDLAGGDIHGLRPRKDSFNEGEYQEVPVAKLDEDDFGIELPASDFKVEAFDEVDKEKCLLVMTAV